MKKLIRLTAITVFALHLTMFPAPATYAIVPSNSGSSESSDTSAKESNIGLSIGRAIERIAATVSQIVSPQPAGSSIAEKAYKPLPNLVCRVSIVYVASYVPIVNWTYRDSKLIPILSSMAITEPIQSQICS